MSSLRRPISNYRSAVKLLTIPLTIAPDAPWRGQRDGAVKALLAMAIKTCREKGKYIGICGQGPSDYPDLAQWLLDQGIESMSLNPDTVVDTWRKLAG